MTGGQPLNENTIADTEAVNIPDSGGLNEEGCTAFEQIRSNAAERRPLSLRRVVFRTQLMCRHSEYIC